jgi:hypothetical protein
LREDYILRVLDESRTALTLDQIHSYVSPIMFTPRQKLRRILTKMNHTGDLKKQTYKVVFSESPRIESVVSEIYFVNDEQKSTFEQDILPRLREETLESFK